MGLAASSTVEKRDNALRLGEAEGGKRVFGRGLDRASVRWDGLLEHERTYLASTETSRASLLVDHTVTAAPNSQGDFRTA